MTRVKVWDDEPLQRWALYERWPAGGFAAPVDAEHLATWTGLSPAGDHWVADVHPLATHTGLVMPMHTDPDPDDHWVVDVHPLTMCTDLLMPMHVDVRVCAATRAALGCMLAPGTPMDRGVPGHVYSIAAHGGGRRFALLLGLVQWLRPDEGAPAPTGGWLPLGRVHGDRWEVRHLGWLDAASAHRLALELTYGVLDSRTAAHHGALLDDDWLAERRTMAGPTNVLRLGPPWLSTAEATALCRLTGGVHG